MTNIFWVWNVEEQGLGGNGAACLVFYLKLVGNGNCGRMIVSIIKKWYDTFIKEAYRKKVKTWAIE